MTIIIISLISNSIILYQEKRYKETYQDNEKIAIFAIVESEINATTYGYKCKVRVDNNKQNGKYKNTCLYFQYSKNYKNKIQYGDKILIEGTFKKAEGQRNYGGFNYNMYLKELKIYGTIEANKIKVISNQFSLFKVSNNISMFLKERIDKVLNPDEATIVKAILLGDTSYIDEQIKENFKDVNILHVLAISGMHISYMILGIKLIFLNALGKKTNNIITIIILIFYSFVTGLSMAIVRACIMELLVILSKLFYRKNDIWTSISIALILTLIYNPYLILNIGLQFSYLGTIGIVLFQKNIYNFLDGLKIKSKKIKYKINPKIKSIIDKVKEMLSVTLSAELAILPVMVCNFNFIGLYSIFANLLVGVIIGPTVILSFLFIIFICINYSISSFISLILSVFIKVLVVISKFSRLPFSKIFITTPSHMKIIFYYLLIILFNILFYIYDRKFPNTTMCRIKNLIALCKYKIFIKKWNRKVIIFIIISIFICTKIYTQIIIKDLKIYFLDVGQGDSTFIITPHNKTILIDGGGSENFDIGKNTVLPYVFDRGYRSIDYIFISHFDQDHVRTD